MEEKIGCLSASTLMVDSPEGSHVVIGQITMIPMQETLKTQNLHLGLPNTTDAERVNLIPF